VNLKLHQSSNEGCERINTSPRTRALLLSAKDNITGTKTRGARILVYDLCWIKIWSVIGNIAQMKLVNATELKSKRKSDKMNDNREVSDSNSHLKFEPLLLL